MRCLAILTVRNEGAFLLEWLAHHMGVGFTDFLVFSNDCQDGTDVMLDRLAQLGHLTHVRNSIAVGRSAQWSALKQADRHPLKATADWVLFLDVDEFVNIHHGAHTLPDLLAALPEATAIALTWRVFGNCGVTAFRDAPITRQFTRAAQNPPLWPWRLGMFKTLFRNDGSYTKLGGHRPKSPDHARLDAARWFDGSGRPLDASYRTRRLFSNFWEDNYQLVQLNHYPLGAMESFILKCDRGRSNRTDTEIGLGYWCERNLCHDEDTSINASWPRTAQALKALKADEQLTRLHTDACVWRKERFEALMLDETLRGLYGQLLLTPPTRAISHDEAARLMAWARLGQAATGAR